MGERLDGRRLVGSSELGERARGDVPVPVPAAVAVAVVEACVLVLPDLSEGASTTKSVPACCEADQVFREFLRGETVGKSDNWDVGVEEDRGEAGGVEEDRGEVVEGGRGCSTVEEVDVNSTTLAIDLLFTLLLSVSLVSLVI